MKKDKKWLKEEISKMSYIPAGLDESNSIISTNWVLSFVEQLEEPEQEKVVIPQFVANWYESNKEDLEDNIDALVRNSRDDAIGRPIETWMLDKTNKPIETLIRMKEGYTIEPPKTLQVIVKNHDNTVYKTELPEDEAMKLIEGWKEDERIS